MLTAGGEHLVMAATNLHLQQPLELELQVLVMPMDSTPAYRVLLLLNI
jgi:hypothetical protein